MSRLAAAIMSRLAAAGAGAWLLHLPRTMAVQFATHGCCSCRAARWLGTGRMRLAADHTSLHARSFLPQVPDYKAGESVYKTRWMPPAKPVGAWGSA